MTVRYKWIINQIIWKPITGYSILKQNLQLQTYKQSSTDFKPLEVLLAKLSKFPLNWCVKSMILLVEAKIHGGCGAYTPISFTHAASTSLSNRGLWVGGGWSLPLGEDREHPEQVTSSLQGRHLEIISYTQSHPHLWAIWNPQSTQLT